MHASAAGFARVSVASSKTSNRGPSAMLIPDPLAPLRQSPVSEEIVRPISELLLTDTPVGTGRARRVVASRLGVSIRGRRRLTLSWEPPNRYSNETVTICRIKGDVSI